MPKAIFLEALEQGRREQAALSRTSMRDRCGLAASVSRSCCRLIRMRATFLGGRRRSKTHTSITPRRRTARDVIGPYKLLEQIGEGGFGVVYMAEQHAAGPPQGRRSKILKPGMDTRQVIARFEAERQALALMDHPNIARVLDAGETAIGPAVFRHGAGQGRADHRLLRPEPADHRASGWSCSLPSARPCSTPIRRGSSTAT